MFKKKPKEQPVEEKKVEEKPKEPEPIIKNVPNPETAWMFVRQELNDYVMCIYNITKQEKTDINTCMSYLLDYIRGHREIDDIADQLDKKVLDEYSKTLKKNGYTVTINIKKDKK